jgi:predicted enzyme related to lactoylglutathione lyase
MKLLWVRLVVDGFDASFDFYRRAMHPTMAAPDHGYSRFWNCSTPNYVELELIERGAAPELLGVAATEVEDVTLVYGAKDVDGTTEAAIAAGALLVRPPHQRGHARVAHVRSPEGLLIEIQHVHVPNFGGGIDPG